MAELHPELAKAKAQTALKFLAGFDGEDFGFLREDTPGPHDRRHLAAALDYIQELSAMVLNLADRAGMTGSLGGEEIARLQRIVAAERERADYVWRNTNTIEKARQEEMAKRDELIAALEAIAKAARDQGPHTGASFSQIAGITDAAIAKAQP